ncbi:hypothetical protein RclHR1_06250004 [Rhizophagus clarus]|uniref:Condensin complex subunit 3 n=1 Tax=Rhizophagus clarus TaxID=94130 RepID=A0A2Z6S9A2_9GLOM|nr:hypothetical protein RclHR1_06250004 [Rhizophagus clarus]GES97373.1 condensin complex subunit 3 [Rhizophagus clarus]
MIRENPLSYIRQFVPRVFQDVQITASNHRKNAVALRKFQTKCLNYNDCGENEFNKEFVKNVNIILPVKKGQANVERIINFIATFIKYCYEEENHTMNDGNTLSSRFTEFLLRHFLKGIEARDKNIRLRVCQLIGIVISSSETIDDDDLREHLRDELTKRLLDKEHSVRVKAVEACSKLQSEGGDIIEKLLRIMQNDPIADVRRAVLLNIEFKEETISHIFVRARDVDADIRRDVYVRSSGEIRDFRVLSIETREMLLRYGLTDRESQVSKACSNLLSQNWIKHANNDLLELLAGIDVVGSNVAQDALLTIFMKRPDIVQTLKFDESFWENLTVESVFLAQVFCEFNKEYSNKLDEVLPDVTTFALYIQKYINLMKKTTLKVDLVECEFIFGQLLIISKFLDYGDEVGRRSMFTLLREILTFDHAPISHIGSIVEIMKRLSIDERDFVRFMTEILSDIRSDAADVDAGDETDSHDSTLIEGESDQLSFQIENELSVAISNLNIRSVTSDPTLITNVKCLSIARYILESSEGRLRNNPPMQDLLNGFIKPNLQSREPLLRELSIHCLGLSCLLDQQLTDENLVLFIRCAKHEVPGLQNKAIMAIFDILMLYGYSFVVENITQGSQILDLLYGCLHQENPLVQATTVQGIAKLMLSKMIYDKDVLKELVALYFDAETETNIRLRQCLCYFFPAYCHSSVENQRLMLQICVPSLVNLMDEYRQPNSNKMVPPLQIAQQLIDWVDPSKVVKSEQNEETRDYGAHAEIAIDIIKELFIETNKELRKFYCQVLNRLNIDESAGTTRFKKLTLLTGNLKTKKPFADAVSRNAFKRFEDSLLRYYGEAPEPLDDNELEQIKDILDFIRNIQEEVPSGRTSVNRLSTRSRSESVTNFE